MSDYGFIRRRYEGDMVSSFIWWNVYSSQTCKAPQDRPLKYFHIGLYLKGFTQHLLLSIRFRRIRGVDKPIRIFLHCNKWTDEEAKAAKRWVNGE